MTVFEDATFIASLFFCIAVGNQYKKLDNPELKKCCGAGMGALTVCLICGYDVLHTVLLVWGNIFIIKNSENRYVHKLSALYTLIYVIIAHDNFDSLYTVWVLQSIALRLVGLAFDVHLMGKDRVNGKIDILDSVPTSLDIFCFAYCFIGIHKGPYYRWRMYSDHLIAPFGKLGDCRVITEQKLKKASFFMAGYVLLRSKYSKKMYSEDQFYNDYGSDFRYWYNVPQLLMYVLSSQCLTLICTSVCTEAGFGVYPAYCRPLPGFGPSVNPSVYKQALSSPSVALQHEYSFSALKCFNNEKLLFGPKMIHTLRSWNMSTRYWFWWYSYKIGFFHGTKYSKSATSFIFWTLWCSPSYQFLIISSTLFVYIHLEEEYERLYNTIGSMKLPWGIGFSIMRIFCLFYLTPCMVLDDIETVIRYYNSIYWIFHLIMVVFIIFVLVVHKSRSNE